MDANFLADDDVFRWDQVTHITLYHRPRQTSVIRNDADWRTDINEIPRNTLIEVKIQHYSNKSLNEKIVVGKMGEDGFYFEDRNELSYDWNIVKWRFKGE